MTHGWFQNLRNDSGERGGEGGRRTEPAVEVAWKYLVGGTAEEEQDDAKRNNQVKHSI